MMLQKLITPAKVVKAARFILALGQSAIQERYLPDSYAHITWLQESLDHFLQPRTAVSSGPFCHIGQNDCNCRVIS